MPASPWENLAFPFPCFLGRLDNSWVSWDTEVYSAGMIQFLFYSGLLGPMQDSSIKPGPTGLARWPRGQSVQNCRPEFNPQNQ